MHDVLFIGGGAAGFFAAARLLESRPGRRVAILEQSGKVLEKIRVSGGGRCNVTNAVFDRESLPVYYPRGWKLMRKLLSRFGGPDTVAWFAARGVELYTQPDNRLFPVTDDSRTIVDCLRHSVEGAGGEVIRNAKVVSMQREPDRWVLATAGGQAYTARNVLVATGSSRHFYDLLAGLGVAIEPPVPSLFTFNIADPLLEGLAGISVAHAQVRIAGSKAQSDGPLLITHWGLSGPAVLKLSAAAARDLHDRGYRFTVLVNWTGLEAAEADGHLQAFIRSAGNRQVSVQAAFGIPKRLWGRLLERAGIAPERRWGELGRKSVNALAETLLRSPLAVTGKTTFKEEFVTCGGVSLKEIDPATMQHRRLPGLNFVGEVLDIDAVTGGYNFQAAWTTAAVAVEGMAGGRAERRTGGQ